MSARSYTFRSRRKGKYTIIVKCAQCGKDTKKEPWILRVHKHVFCSRQCADTFRRFQPGRTHKRCGACKQIFLLSEFSVKSNAVDGLYCYCKACVRQKGIKYRKKNHTILKERRKEHYKRDPLLFKQRALRNKYHLTIEQLQGMHHLQDGLCAICKTEPAEHIDHNHQRKSIRGLLCNKCNVGLGMFKENISFLLSAIQYLQKWNHTL